MYRDIMLTVMNRKASHAKDVSLETCLRADVSYFLCCTWKRSLFRVQQRKWRRLHVGNSKRSLFQAFRQWRAVRSQERDEKQRGAGERGLSPLPLPCFYFSALLLLRTAPHYLNACNRLLETGKLFMKDALGIDDVSLNYFANLRRSKSVYHQLDYAN